MMALSSELSTAWAYDFVRTAAVAGTVCAALASCVGYFVLLRRMAFAAHALGHISFAGACAGVILGCGALPGMLALNVIAAAGMGFMGDRVQKSDLVVGMTLCFALGLGTLFLSLFKGYAGQANVILFGNLLAVSHRQLWVMALLAVGSLLALLTMFRPLLFSSLEPELAEAKGVPLRLISVTFYLLVAIAVAVASQMMGVLLVFALLVGPAAIAQHLCRTVWPGILLALAIAVAVTWISLILAYATDWPVSFWVPSLLFAVYVPSAPLRNLRFNT
jgi:zinc/manganese transport system permease protein